MERNAIDLRKKRVMDCFLSFEDNKFFFCGFLFFVFRDEE
jgi:hypothetical protein